MPLAIGDQLWFDGALGEVVAVTATTDENGRGSVSYGGRTFRFRVLKALPAGETEFPWVATDDAYWRMGLVKHREADLYCLVSDDPPAPGWGRWIQQRIWKEAGDFAGEDSVVFILGWRPGTITIKKGGVVQPDVYADFVLLYDTDLDGECEAWWQPVYPYADGKGSFRTDASGHLWDVRTGSPQHIIVPRGFAALGHRPTDTWPSMPEPERTLSELRLYYLQEHTAVQEGQDATLDVAGVEITINGPPSAKYELVWEDVVPRPDVPGNLDGNGTATEIGLPPGEYVVVLHHPSDLDKGLPRSSVAATTSGASYTVDFPDSWAVVPPNRVQGVVYAYGAQPLSGATVWSADQDAPVGSWRPLTTTGADGAFGPIPCDPADDFLMVSHDDHGAVIADVGATTLWWDPCIAGRMGGIASAQTEALPEGTLIWGPDGSHTNMPAADRFGYLQAKDGRKYWLSPGHHGGVKTEPMPRYHWTPSDGVPGGSASPVRLMYDAYDADGSLLSSDHTIGDDHLPTWSSPSLWYCSNAGGGTLTDTLGGQVHGSVIEADCCSPISSQLVEPWRLGLEFGREDGPLEFRMTGDGAGTENTTPLTFSHWQCPYCHGPLFTEPSKGACSRWYCMNGDSVDGRSAVRTRTLAAINDWAARIVKVTTGGTSIDALIAGHPRPEEYDETDSYVQTVGGLSRWVATHITLGTLRGGSFTDGESMSDAESRLGRTLGPVMLKLELQADYHGTGKAIHVHATGVHGNSDTLAVVVPAGAVAGDWFPLKWAPHHEYPRGYYTDVTGAQEVSGDGYLDAAIVNDGPAWHSTEGVAVNHHTSTPWACDVRLATRGPDLEEDFVGRVHLVYCRDGRVLHRISEDCGTRWTSPNEASSSAGLLDACQDPSNHVLVDARILVSAYSATKTRFLVSEYDGAWWVART